MPIKSSKKAVNKEIAKISKSVDKAILQAKDFWFGLIKDIPLNTQLPYKSNLVKIQNKVDEKYTCESIHFVLSKNLSKCLKSYVKENNLLLFSVLAATYGVIVSKYSNQEQLLLSSPINPQDQLLNHSGLINYLPLKLELNKFATLKQLILNISLQLEQIKSFQDYPLSQILEDQRQYNHIDVDNYLNVGFTDINSSLASNLILDEKATSRNDHIIELGLYYDDADDNKIKFRLEYQQNLFEDSVIKSLASSFQDLLHQVIIEDSMMLKDLCVLDKESYQKIVYEWNQTSIVYPRDKTIHQLFEEQARRTPNNIAVVYEDKRLTYKELNEKSNQLANYLHKAYNIKPDDLIALCLDRSEHMLIAILGVLKSGGAYVPMDPSYPTDRITYIVSDTKSIVVLINEIYQDKLQSIINKQSSYSDLNSKAAKLSKANHKNKVVKDSNLLLSNPHIPFILSIDSSETKKVLNQQDKGVLSTSIVSSSNLAYVIYTSGTTGRPKGVMIEHTSVVSLLLGLAAKYGVKPQELFLLFANYVFDASVEQMFLPILNGASLYVVNQLHIRDVNFISNFISENKINHIHATPSYLQELNYNLLTSVSRVISAGEKLPEQLFQHLRTKVNQLYNKYGPTETTVSALISLNSLFIGTPLSNVKVYILDKTLNPVPVGVIGELCIGGVGVARGYLNLPQLTLERFITNPFQTKEEKKKSRNGKLYKTGDLVRYLADGNIEYIGRNDFQVKIRGYRIELGEIEHRLSSYFGITQAVVLVHEYEDQLLSTSNYLVGYYVAKSKLNETDILAYLVKHLPEHMVPSILIHLEKLPLTLNGKLDRKALPKPDFTNQASYVAPRNKLDTDVCAVYATILGLKTNVVGIKDDFFRLGGNSILAIKLVNQLNQLIFHDMNYSVCVADILKQKTIFNLVDFILNGGSNRLIIPQIKYTKKDLASGLNHRATLSFAQERLLFIDSYEGGSSAYNISIIKKLSNSVDVGILVQALQSTVLHHQVLHSLIKVDIQGNSFQEISDLTIFPFKIPMLQVNSQDELFTILDKAIKYVYKLDQEYPIKINIVEHILDNQESIICKTNVNADIKSHNVARYLSIVVHHIAFDGWSVDVFLKDVLTFYEYYNQVKLDHADNLTMPQLNKLNIQYSDFAVWQKNYLTGDALEQQLSYWKNKLNNFENLNLITDKVRPKSIEYAGKTVKFKIDEQISNALRELAKELEVSLYSVLLSGFNLLLRAYSNQDDIIIGTPIANRHHQQLEGLVGFFVNSLVLRSIINHEDIFRDYIKTTGGEVIDAQLHQDLPFEKLVDELRVAKDQSRHPIFQVMFGVQFFGTDLDFSAVNSLVFASDGDYHIEELPHSQAALFDMTMLIDDSKDELCGTLNYAVSLFNEATIHSYIETYQQILREIVVSPSKKISQLSYLNKITYKKIIYDWNKTNKDYPQNKTIHQLFEEQVERTPNNIAVVYEDKQFTYKELDQKANQLANYLHNVHKIKPDDLVTLCLDRNEHMLIAILGVLKSSGAYVPLDPSYPIERIRYILSDTKTKVVLTNQEGQEKLSDMINTLSDIQILPLDVKVIQDKINQQNMFNSLMDSSSNNLAYVIYTSGTTGKPKGVMIEHNSVINLISNMVFNLKLNTGMKVSQYSNYVFDASIYESFPILSVGGELHILNSSIQRDISLFIDYSIKCKLDRSFIPTAVLNQINEGELNLLTQSIIYTGGDRLHNFTYIPRTMIVYNYYGPTEATVCATYAKVIANKDVTIGKPIQNIQVYVLDSDLNPLPVGAIGELYIGGNGLARGYLNLSELTRQQFITNPFQTAKEKQDNKNGRLYKTGDLVRYLPDGNIDYIGRNDSQVEISGYRIELGEIEARLLTYPGIKQVVVLDREYASSQSGSNRFHYLIAYYVADMVVDKPLLLKYLADYLPEYMIPSGIVHLYEFPLTLNGKLNKKALPDYKFIDQSKYVAPRSTLERNICAIYGEVLGIDISLVGITDDFFRLGGSSILTMKLVSRLNNEVLNDQDFKVSVADIFTHKTILNLVDSLLRTGSSEVIRIPRINYNKEQISKGLDKQAKLSFAQERLWFIENYEGGSNAYNVPLIRRLSTNIDLDSLEYALQSTILRHEVLHSYIKTDSTGNGYQETGDLIANPFRILNYSVSTSKQLLEQISNEVNYVFDLEKEYPLKISIIEKIAQDSNKNDIINNSGECTKYLVIVVHHIAFDGWSVDIFLQDLIKYYSYSCRLKLEKKRRITKVNVNFNELNIQYKDFAVWQRNYLTEEKLADQLIYWKSKLTGYENLNLITDKTRPIEINYLGDSIHFKIDKETSYRLRSLAKELNVSLYSLLLSGFSLLLRVYSNQDDIVVGSPFANRHYQQVQDLVGFFINNLAIRTIIEPQQIIIEYIQMVGDIVRESQLHQDLPFEKLVEGLKVEKDQSRHPIFQIMFSVQSFNFGVDIYEDSNYPIFASSSKLDDDASLLSRVYKVAKFDLTAIIDESQDELYGYFNYATSLFDELTITGYIETYLQILKNIVAKPNQKICELNYLDQELYNKVVHSWNKTEKLYPENKTIHQLFEEQVQKTPDNIAVMCEDHKLTYKELHEKSNQLANYLNNSYKIKTGDLIALCLDRSEYILIAILGVLKSGAAYVPIDSGYPEDRIEYILSDTNVKLVLTNQVYVEKFSIINGVIKPNLFLCILDAPETTCLLANLSSIMPITEVAKSSDLAYIIYTSGTTGKPKGVMISHNSVVNYILNAMEYFYSNNIEIVDYSTNIAFDLTVTTTLGALCTGMHVSVYSGDISDIENYKEHLLKHKITFVKLVPSYFELICAFLAHSTINKIVLGGEKLSINLLKKIATLNIVIYDEYGPTEATVGTLNYRIDSEMLHKIRVGELSKLNLGRPYFNYTLYILNKNLVPLPINAVGELYIGGVGLSSGYLNLIKLTNERFITNPFQTEIEKKQGKNSRLYKTGDLVRYLSDGSVEYIGRNDFQVKIRGYRIELGEIETRLSNYPEVTQAVVLVKEHKLEQMSNSAELSQDLVSSPSKYLVGYYVSSEKLDESNILSYLSEQIPEYMVPTVLVYLDKLPLTINGKLDQKALPDPEFINKDNYVAPRNELEFKVCDIYARLLGLDGFKVGISDDFFRLGGDSIVSIQLVSRLRQQLGLLVSVKDVFSCRTVEKLYDQVLAKQVADTCKLAEQILSEEGILTKEVPLLPIQEWFFGKVELGVFTKKNHWNQSFLIRVGKLDKELLIQSLEKLIEYHDAFRLNYTYSKSSGYKQYYSELSTVKFDLHYLDISKSNKDIQDILTSWQSKFDLLENKPLYSIGYIDGYADGSSRIFFALHHLLVDVVSWRIIVHDLQEVYSKLKHSLLSKQEVEDILGSKGTSYRQWVNQVYGYKDKHSEELNYWQDQLIDLKVIQAKLENLVLDSKQKIPNRKEFSLDKKYTNQLLTKTNQAYHTEINDILLSAFALALSKICNQNINYITLEGHGREEIDKQIDITRTVGWFTTMYPVKLEVSKDSLARTIINIKEQLRSIPNKGVGYGALCGYNNLPKVNFNYLGQLDQGKSTKADSEKSNNLNKEWQIAGEKSGISISSENEDTNIINANGYVSEGKLNFGISSKLSEEQLERLTNEFRSQLERILEHTANLDRSYLTRSDVDNIISQEYLDKLQKDKEISHVYLANSLQQGFIYHANQGSNDDAYFEQIIWQYENKLDPSNLKLAWEHAQSRFPTLRLRFAWDNELVQVIDKTGTIDWYYYDLSNESQNAQELIITDYQMKDRLQGFDLQNMPLFRIYLFKHNSKLYTCMLSNHHAILDGWSNPILLSYVHECYSKLMQKQTIVLQIEQSYMLTQEYLQLHKDDNKNYWLQYISQIEDYADLSGLLKPEQYGVKLSEYKHIIKSVEQRLVISNDEYDKLKKFASENGITLNAILQYTWHKILSVYGNISTTVIGMTISGRNLPINDIEGGVGLFINTLPIIVKHKIDESVIDSIKQLQTEINEANSHSNINLAQLHSGSGRLFDNLFVYENYPSQITNTKAAITVNFKGAIEKLDYPLVVIAYERQGEQIIFNLKYAGELFSKEMIESVLKTIKILLLQIMNSTKYTKVSTLEFLGQDSYNLFIEKQKQTSLNPNLYNKTIHQLFEEQVAKTPSKIALVYEDIELTYKELDQRSNQLAHYLRNVYKIKEDNLIALYLYRSEYMLIAILAILKAGGAYVPLDVQLTEERITHILSDTHAKIVLTNEKNQQKLALIINKINSNISNKLLHNDSQIDLLALDNIKVQALLIKQSVKKLIKNSIDNNLVYVIYTSGTTGKPKGVMLEHGGAVIRIISMIEKSQITSKSKYLFKTNYVFDVSFSDIFTTLIAGGELYLTKEVFDIDEIINLIKAKKINICHFVPSQLSVMLEELTNSKLLPQLKTINVSGEGYNKNLLLNTDYLGKVVNYYGPTETGEVSYEITDYGALNTQRNVLYKQVTIGYPISNSNLYILDKTHNLLPIGATGELYIAGDGLARGYLNLPELTKEKFIDNLFQKAEEKKQGKNSRLYKTGDLARYLSDGNIEYIGRNDFQVKIRGYRIELGEIEGKLLSYPGIKQVVVLVKEDSKSVAVGNSKDAESFLAEGADIESSNKYLVGYYVSDHKLNEDEVRNYLAEHLPEYMVPSIIIHLLKLPLTINGKLDRKALPEVDFNLNQANHISPISELELKVCSIYADVLGIPIDNIGMTDDFFRLGGNSILAIKLVSKLKRDLDLNLNVSSIFKHKTIATLIKNLLLGESDTVIITKALPQKYYPLSFAQERLWFIDKYEGGSDAYNIPLLFQLKNDICTTSLEQSFLAIIDRHEILRSVIRTDDNGSGYQLLKEGIQPSDSIIKYMDVATKKQLDVLLEESMRYRFDLENEYPIKIIFYTNKQNKHKYSSVVIHHIAFDGWSIDVLLRELKIYYDYYENLRHGTESVLNIAPLSIQYKDFAVWQKTYLSGEHLANELSYWSKKLNNFETLNLPLDKPRPLTIDYRGSSLSFILNDVTSNRLRELAKTLEVSLYSVLLSGFYLLLRSYSNQNDIVIGTPIASRNYNQIENLIGFFVNSLALRVEIDSQTKVIEFIKHVGHNVIEAQLHQDLPFEKLVEQLNVEKDQSRHPIFQVMFGVQHFGNTYQQLDVKDNVKVEKLLDCYSIKVTHEVAKVDLTLILDDSENQLRGVFNYATSLFQAETIKNMIDTYEILLEQVVSLSIQDLKQINQLNYLNKDSYQKIINDWNKTKKDYPSDKAIHKLFEEQVQRTPNNLAVVYEDIQLTYKELNERSNQLANYLYKTYKVEPNDLIALCLDRNEYILVAILGALKSGGAYVPMDPSYPIDRISYILSDTKSKILLTNEVHEAKLQSVINKNIEVLDLKSSNTKSNVEAEADQRHNNALLNDLRIPFILSLDSAKTNEILNQQAKESVSIKVSSSNLAYVIYTSGTTGKPKGVMIEHNSLVNFVNYKLSYIHKDDMVVSFINYTFDAINTEIFPAIIAGVPLHILSSKVRADLVSYSQYLLDHKITYAVLPGIIANEFIANYDLIKLNLRVLISGGERCETKTLLFKMVNQFGPTETTVCSLINAHYNVTSASNIGKPIDNTSIYILSNNVPVPLGAIGELYIGGAGLARGYLNQTELTAERFISNPFQTEAENQQGKNARLYKTGDLVRYLPDGNIEYIGRNDFQVKIRGYRIEIGEIENRLCSYPGVNQAVVLAKEHKSEPTNRSVEIVKSGGGSTVSSTSKYLVGYYVSENKLDEEMILSYLTEHLPEYMVPSVLVSLDKLPLTINGKLDQKALPNPEFTSQDNYIAPRNELEIEICKIYAEVLNLDSSKIGIGNDFFRLGGNSILAIKLIAKLNYYCQAHLKVAEIFSAKSIEKLVPLIMRSKNGYKTLIKLNSSSSDKLAMFMIHPGSGGCEVYTSLANRLNDYICYGIDNYNLYNKTKLLTLNKLANYYIGLIRDTGYLENKDHEVILLGWSMGGLIALEIAYILEQQGYSEIKVYLLDTLIQDKNVHMIFDTNDHSNDKQKYLEYMLPIYGVEYANQVINNYDVEYKINQESVSGKLNTTSVILYKALQKDKRINSVITDKLFEYISQLKYNNLDKLVKDINQVKLINLEEAAHGNVLEYEDIILAGLINI